MIKERDSQRSKVYKAENTAFANLAIANERHNSVQNIQRFLNYIYSLKRVQDSFPAARLGEWSVNVKDGRGRRRTACADVRMINMPGFSRISWVICHELSHTITIRELGSRVAGHGWQFCANYLRLVLLVLGREAHDALKAKFKQHRVRFTEPRKRAPISPERKAQLLATLAAARAARLTTTNKVAA